MAKEDKITMEDVLAKLRSNHFYPTLLVEAGSVRTLVGVEIFASPIMMDSKLARVKEVLVDFPVQITSNTNEQYILVTLKGPSKSKTQKQKT